MPRFNPCAGACVCLLRTPPAAPLTQWAEVLLTTQWKIQLFLPHHCLVSPKPGLTAQGLQKGGIVLVTFELLLGARRLPGVLGPSALVRGAGELWVMAGLCCCTLPSAEHISEVSARGSDLKPHFSPLLWQQPFLSDFTPHQRCPFPQESRPQPHGSAAWSLASL